MSMFTTTTSESSASDAAGIGVRRQAVGRHAAGERGQHRAGRAEAVEAGSTAPDRPRCRPALIGMPSIGIATR